MKSALTKLLWPILKRFETDIEPANYKKSHRSILIIVGSIFVVLSTISAGIVFSGGQWGGLVPVVVFFSIGFVAVVVGALGSNGAVSKIWGTK